MSLLNQVLQDLDERAPTGEMQPVRLSVAPAAARSTDDQEDEGPDWVRLAAGVAVASAFVAAVLIFYSADGDPVERQEVVHRALTPPVVELKSALAPALQPETAAGIGAEDDVTISGFDEKTGVPPVGVVDLANSPPTTADRQALSGQAVPAANESSMTRPAGPVSAQQVVPDNSPAVPPQSTSGVNYLPLRNTVMAAEQATAAQAPHAGRKAGVSVKTPKSPAAGEAELARLAIERGELSSAEVLLQRHLQFAPGDQDARELLVGLMLRGDRQDAAMQQLVQGLKQQPGHVKFSLIRARLLAQRGEVSAAIAILEKPSSSRTGRVERLQMLGALYQQQSRYEQAVGSYRSLLEMNSSVGSSWVGLAISLDGLGDSAARQAYRRALQLGGLPAAAETYARQRVSQLESNVD